MFKQLALLVCFIAVVLAESSSEKKTREEGAGLNQGEFASEALMAHNLYRKIHGVPALKLNSKLSGIAFSRARDLAAEGKLNVKQILFRGENLGETVGTVGGFSSYNGISATQLWYSVVSKFDEEGETSNEGASFTQMVWKKTEEVGFGIAKAKDGKFYFVAEYFPSGNIRGKYEDNVFQLTDEEVSSGNGCIKQSVVDMWKQLLAKANLKENGDEIRPTVEQSVVEVSNKKNTVTSTSKPIRLTTPAEEQEEEITTTKTITTTRPITTTRTTTEEMTSTTRVVKPVIIFKPSTEPSEEVDETTTKRMKPITSTQSGILITKTTTESVMIEEEQVTTTRRLKPVSTTAAPIDVDTLVSQQVEVELTTRRPASTTTSEPEVIEFTTRKRITTTTSEPEIVEVTTISTTRRSVMKPTLTTVNPDLIITADSSVEETTIRTTTFDQVEEEPVRTTTMSSLPVRLTTPVRVVEEDEQVTTVRTTTVSSLPVRSTTPVRVVEEDEPVATVRSTTTIRSELLKEAAEDEDVELNRVSTTTTKNPKTITTERTTTSTEITTTEEPVSDRSTTRETTSKSSTTTEKSTVEMEETTVRPVSSTKSTIGTKARLSQTVFDETKAEQRPSKSKLLETIKSSEQTSQRFVNPRNDERELEIEPSSSKAKKSELVRNKRLYGYYY